MYKKLKNFYDRVDEEEFTAKFKEENQDVAGLSLIDVHTDQIKFIGMKELGRVRNSH